MRRFRFSLGRVLAVRRLAERQARAAFLEARAQALTARAKVEAVRGELERGRAILAASQSQLRLAPGEVIAQQAAVEALRERFRDRQRQALAVEQAAEIAKSAWESARAAVRGLERLEERRRAAHGADQERAEGRQQDEHSLSHRTRSQSGNQAPFRGGGTPAAGSSAGAPLADESAESNPGAAPPGAPGNPSSW